MGLIGLLAACGGGDAPAADNPDTGETDTVSQPDSPDDSADNVVDPETVPVDNPADNAGLVARVNGEGITQAEFERSLARRLQDSTVTDEAALRASVLDTLIEQTLVEQAAAEMGIVVTDEAAQEEVRNLQQSVASEDEWESFLQLNGYTEDEMLEAQRDALLTREVQDQLFGTLQGDVPQVRARHILLRTEQDAQLVLERLQAGESFESLAATYSVDLTTQDQGGNLGWFTRYELLDDRLAEIAFSLETNQIAGPIATRIGYHIIQTLETADRPVETERMAMLMRNVYINWLDEQMQTAEIERYLP